MFKKILWLSAFVSSSMVNQMVFADSSFCRKSLNEMVQSIGVDAIQKAKIKPILDQLKSNLKTSESQMDGLESQITQQVNSTNMDKEKIDSLVDEKTKLIGNMIKAKIMAENQIFSITSPQQKVKLQEMIKKSDEKMATEFKKCPQD